MSTKNQQRRAKLQKKNEKRAHDAEVDTYLSQCILEVAQKTEEASAVIEATQKTEEAQPDATSATNIAEPTRNPNTISKGGEFGVSRQVIINKANEIWKALKSYAIANAEFRDLKDQEKLDLFRSKFGCAQFMDEFPIVSRYMICYGQFSSKAFERMLRKIENVVHPPPDAREKNYMEDQWVQRQADYVQYLWESYQKRHQSNAERQWVWKETYDRLKKEFDDFRTMHKDIEERVKNERKSLAGQNARELLERLVGGQEALTTNDEEILLAQLKEVFEKKNNPVAEPEEPPASKEPKILMIESVDNERMAEIDDKYKPVELRGMEPVMEMEMEASAESNVSANTNASANTNTGVDVDVDISEYEEILYEEEIA